MRIDLKTSMGYYRLKLFIHGKSRTLEETMRFIALIDEVLPYQYELEVIDVLQNPEVAEDLFIVCTPTLVRYEPAPRKEIIGYLTDPDLLLEHITRS
jgi:circadian clock protein KaiB